MKHRGAHLLKSVAGALVLLFLMPVVDVSCEESKPSAPGRPVSRQLEALDTTGDPLATIQYAIVDGRTGRARVKQRTAQAGAHVEVATGDEVVVYARGYHPERLRVGNETTITVRMRRALESCLVDASFGIGERWSVIANVQQLILDPIEKSKALIKDLYEVRIVDGGTRIATPRDVRTLVFPKSYVTSRSRERRRMRRSKGLVSPVVFHARAGQRQTLTLTPYRTVEIVGPGAQDLEVDLDWSLVHTDLLYKPDWKPEQVDVILGLRGGRVYGQTMRLLPLRYHLFLSIRKTPHYAVIEPTGTSVRLGGKSMRAITAPPVLNGQPAGPGTVIAPGRLHLDAIQRLLNTHEAERFRYQVPKAGWGKVVRLPTADWLTLWHPATGLAYAPWKAGRVPRATSAPGSINVVIKGAESTSMTITVWPHRRGSGARITGAFHDRPWSKVSATGSVSFEGLPLGHYRVLVRPSEGGVAARKSAAVTLSHAHATASVEIGFK